MFSRTITFGSTLASLVVLLALVCLPGEAQRGWIARDANVDSRNLLVASVLQDGQGNVYTLIRSPESRLIKYNGSGAQVWRRELGQYTSKISLQGPDGDIFIGGDFTSQGVGGSDIFVAKYAAQDGSLRWSATYGSGEYYEDYFEDMGVDSSGDICLVGHSEKERESFPVIVKFRGIDGLLLWRSVGPGNNAKAVAVDDAGNIYVTGGSAPPTKRLWVYKFSAGGAMEWSRSYSDLAATGVDVAVNDSGVYVLGKTSSGWILLKYPPVNPGSDPEWSIQYNEGTASPRKLLLDGNGRIYVVGYASDGASYKGVVVAYVETPGGQVEQSWRVYVGDAYRYSGYGGSTPYDIDIAVSNNLIYVASVVFRRTGRYEHGDFLIGAYNAASGQMLWQMRYGEDASGGSTPYNETASRLTADDVGNIYVAGSSFSDSFEEEAVGTGEVIIIKCAALQLVASVELDGYSGDLGSVWDDVQLRAGRTEADRSVQVVMRSGKKALPHNADGSLPIFLLPDAAEWAYDVAFKPYRAPCPPGDDVSHWLRVADVNTQVVEGLLNASVTALNGDIDGDGEITLFDFGLLQSAFGSICGEENWNPAADLDGDGEITLFDFGILTRNFGAIGEPSWWDE